MAKKKASAKKATKTSKLQRIDMPLEGNLTGDPRMMMEQFMRNLQKVMADEEFETVEEANRFIGKMPLGTLRAPFGRNARSAQEEAQDLAYQAMEASSRKQAIALARKALAKDGDCVDALVVLNDATSETEEQAIAGLEKAVAAGARSLGQKFFHENTGHFWGFVEARPYMRARMQLAGVLQGAGRIAEAISHYEAMLNLNPNDNQGVRDILINCCLETKDLEGARRILRKYSGEIGVTFAWAKVMERYLSGDLPGAGRALSEAQKQNRFVELYLTGQKRFPGEMPSMYSLGSEEEALIALQLMAGPVKAHPEMLAWITAALLPGFQGGDRTFRRLARRGKLPRQT